MRKEIIFVSGGRIVFKGTSKDKNADLDIYDVVSYYNELLIEHRQLEKKFQEREKKAKLLDALLTLLQNTKK